MKLVIRNIVVTFIIIANLAFMTGIAINHHICTKTNSQTQSIYLKTKCDHQHECNTQKNNEDEQLPDCCKNNQEHSNDVCFDDEDSCCENTMEFISINDYYTISVSNINFVVDCSIAEVSPTNDILAEKELIKTEDLVVYNDFENLSQNYNISFIQTKIVPVS
jgi:hypothetical protein